MTIIIVSEKSVMGRIDRICKACGDSYFGWNMYVCHDCGNSHNYKIQEDWAK